jgi:hypothetical protein
VAEFVHTETVFARVFRPYPTHQAQPSVVVDRVEHGLGHAVSEEVRPTTRDLVETAKQFVQFHVAG